MPSLLPRPIGRFAPSPTGQLHLGSIYTAIASFCHIKSLGGQWLVRIEDTDFERCQTKFSDLILQDLQNMGLFWDGQVVYQSKRQAIYDDFINQLPKLTYPCTCSRKQLDSIGGSIYPRLCIPNSTNPKTPTIQTKQATPKKTPLSQTPLSQTPLSQTPKIRLQLPNIDSVFCDDILGVVHQNPQKLLGDVVIKRNNGIINYIWSSAIDDSLQNISHIVRGADILQMTLAQLSIQKMFGLNLPCRFAHLPLLLNTQNQKLSKQNLATPIDTTNIDSCRKLWVTCLTLLGQNPPDTLIYQNLDEIVQFAIDNWSFVPLRKSDDLIVQS